MSSPAFSGDSIFLHVFTGTAELSVLLASRPYAVYLLDPASNKIC